MTGEVRGQFRRHLFDGWNLPAPKGQRLKALPYVLFSKRPRRAWDELPRFVPEKITVYKPHFQLCLTEDEIKEQRLAHEKKYQGSEHRRIFVPSKLNRF